MATPKPGEIRCPTCHRSTPPASFCTQCGSRIPPDALARPRGMDRDELQERIRARRSGGDPWRRGAPGGDEPDAYGAERYEPLPEDANARRGPSAPSDRVDYYSDAREALGLPPAPEFGREQEPGGYDRWSAARAVPPDSFPSEGQPAYRDASDAQDAYDGYAPDGYATDGYGYDYPYAEERQRRGGGAGLAILGVLALGVLALMGGAVLAGVIGGDGVADATATPTATAAQSVAGTADPTRTAAPTAAPPTATPAPSGGPVVFPDGFVAEAQPCLPGTANINGCNSNGNSNSGTVDIWVGFEKGTADDVVGATLVGPDGTVVAEGFIDLARIGCARTCNGWTRFNFSGLDPGVYEVRITRNGDPAGNVSFEVV